MSLIRARQRVVTAVFPHNANRRFIIPNRSGGVEPPDPPDPPALGPNLVLNGGFDTDLIGWEGTSGTRTWVAGGKIRIEPTGGRIVLQNTEATNGPVGGGVYAAGDYEFHLLGVDNQLGVPLNLDIYNNLWGDLYTDNAITLTDTVIPMTFTESHAGLVIYLNSVGTTAANFIEIDAVEVRAKL